MFRTRPISKNEGLVFYDRNNHYDPRKGLAKIEESYRHSEKWPENDTCKGKGKSPQGCNKTSVCEMSRPKEHSFDNWLSIFSQDCREIYATTENLDDSLEQSPHGTIFKESILLNSKRFLPRITFLLRNPLKRNSFIYPG